MVAIGQWTPDQAQFGNPGSSEIINALPRTIGSYGPAFDMATATGALSATCQGAMFTRDNAAAVWGFAGDATKLYKNVSGSTAWTNVSKSGGYVTGAEERWSFVQFNELILATNYADPIQAFNMASSTAFVDLASGTAPQARYAARVNQFLMVANTNDPIDGPVPQRVWWSAIGAPSIWPTPGTISAAQVQSDFQDLAGDGGWNMGIVGGLAGADVAIFQERNIWRGQYVGPAVIFRFDRVENARGTPAPGSIVQVGPLVYYLADDGFYAFDGAQSVSIGDQKFDKTFLAEVDGSYLHRISAAADPLNKLVYWAYPGPQNEGGTPNRILVYHYGLGRAAPIHDVAIEVMVGRGITTGYTLEQLDAFGTLETLPFPLDSRAWTGGNSFLAAFDTNHKMSFFAGAAKAATLDTTEANLNDGGITHINRVWPIVDSLDAMVAIGRRNRITDEVSWTDPAPISGRTGSVGIRGSGMYLRGRITIPAGSSWGHAQGLMLDGRKAGRS